MKIFLKFPRKSTHFILIGISLFLISGCQNGEFNPDVSDIAIPTEIIRFEQSFFKVDTQSIVQGIDQLIQQYPDFSDVLFYQIINKPRHHDDIYETAKAFLSDTFIQHLYQDCTQKYSRFEHLEKEFTKAFQYFRYYFPDKMIPSIYTCLSGFEVGSFTIGENIVGAGLDFFLGKDYPFYDPNLFPEYIRKTMDMQFLVPKTIQAMVENYVGDPDGTRMLDIMIRNGKALYIKKKLLPETSDTIIFEHTGDQMKWLWKNESQIWAHFLEEKLLYETNFRKFQKLVTPSPNTPNMPPEAPGRVANWMGYNIISAYMKRNPDLTLAELLDQLDSQKILNDSKYKPRRSI